MEKIEKSDLGVGKLVLRLISVTGICLVVYLAISSFNIGKIYGNELVVEHSEKIETIKNEFVEGKEIFCKNNIVSLKNNWSYDSEKEMFINDGKYLKVKDCISTDSKISILKLVKEYFKIN